jgi:hypothetical protein
MNKTLTTAIALLATGAANAACLSTDQFDTAESAAIAALNVVNPLSVSDDRVYIGEVFQVDGQYGYAWSRLDPRDDGGRVTLAHSSDAETVALFRTSGRDNVRLNNRSMSSLDRQATRRLDVDYYIADSSGELYIAEEHASNYDRIGPDNTIESSPSLQRASAGNLPGSCVR